VEQPGRIGGGGQPDRHPQHPAEGNSNGNWLTTEQAKELLAVPDRSTLKGKREYVIPAMLVGCVLRRQELAALDVGTIQMREGRWVLVDSKGRRVWGVAVPMWVKIPQGDLLFDRGRGPR
jgi:integrase